jgi:truncated hemoglobin YjbI
MTGRYGSSLRSVAAVEDHRESHREIPSLPLIDRLGGLPVVAWIADRFVERILDDPKLAVRFVGVDVSAFKMSQDAFLRDALGGCGAVEWSGPQVILDGEELAHLVLHLNDTLEALGVSPSVIEQVFFALVARAMAPRHAATGGTVLAPSRSMTRRKDEQAPVPPPDREPGTRPDGEAMPPQAIDPGAHDRPDEQPANDRARPQPNTDATGF